VKKKFGYGAVLGVALIAASACGSSSPTEPTTNPPSTPAGPTAPAAPSGSSAFEDEVLTLTNRRRAEGATCSGAFYPSVPPLTLDSHLRDAARGHSQDMAANNFFSHTSPDGSTPSTRASRSGYTSGYVGENIAAGQASAQAAVDTWMKSTSGHCENIMNGRYRVIGVGYAFRSSSAYQHYWTQAFGG
jgi:uncharacterized protein YkwD